MMWTYTLIATAILSGASARGTEIIATSSNCGKVTYLWEDAYSLTYNGGYLSDWACSYKFDKVTSELDKEICVEQVKFDLPCGVTVKYDVGHYTGFKPFETFTCDKRQTKPWCIAIGSVHIGFEKTRGASNGSVVFKIYKKGDTTEAPKTNTAATVAAIVGMVIAIIAVTLTIVGIAVIVRRRRGTGGTVSFANPQTT